MGRKLWPGYSSASQLWDELQQGKQNNLGCLRKRSTQGAERPWRWGARTNFHSRPFSTLQTPVGTPPPGIFFVKISQPPGQTPGHCPLELGLGHPTKPRVCAAYSLFWVSLARGMGCSRWVPGAATHPSPFPGVGSPTNSHHPRSAASLSLRVWGSQRRSHRD